MEVSTYKEKKKQELFLEDVLSITHRKWFVNRFIEKSLKNFLIFFLILFLYTLCIQKCHFCLIFIEQNRCFVQCITGCNIGVYRNIK